MPRGLGGREAGSSTVGLPSVKVVRGKGRRLTARVSLTGLAKGTAKVTVVAPTTTGRVVRETRTYRTCTRRR